MTLTITEVSRATGLSSRALRHYEALGLICSSRANNGYRTFDDSALVTLQRIVVLRELGVGLARTAEILAQPGSAAMALAMHASELRAQRDRLDRQIQALERSAIALELGEPIMSADPFDGFDHTVHEAEVTERWGADAYRQGDRWWRSMSAAERADWQTAQVQLAADWTAAAASGTDPTGPAGQSLAARHADWLRSIPGTPSGPRELPDYLRGLGDLYVADERLAANYGGAAGAAFVRDALAAYADTLGG